MHINQNPTSQTIKEHASHSLTILQLRPVWITLQFSKIGHWPYLLVGDSPTITLQLNTEQLPQRTVQQHSADRSRSSNGSDTNLPSPSINTAVISKCSNNNSDNYGNNSSTRWCCCTWFICLDLGCNIFSVVVVISSVCLFLFSFACSNFVISYMAAALACMFICLVCNLSVGMLCVDISTLCIFLKSFGTVWWCQLVNPAFASSSQYCGEFTFWLCLVMLLARTSTGVVKSNCFCGCVYVSDFSFDCFVWMFMFLI